MSRLTRRAQFFIQQSLADPRVVALREFREKPARTIRIAAAEHAILVRLGENTSE
jgi:hypothetical protein